MSVHRWLGLTMATLFVIVGLSGSFLAFYPEIDRFLNPELATTTGSGARAPMRDVLAAVEPHLDSRFLHSVFPSEGGRDVHHVWLTPSARDQSRMWEVLVDPYTTEVRGERAAVPVLELSKRNIANTIYTLHFQLFAGQIGSTIVGFSGIFLLFSAISGLVLWWPRSGGWRRSLSIKPAARGYRLHFDLHRVTGSYSVPVLIVVAFTGICLTFPGYVRPLFQIGATETAREGVLQTRPIPPPIDADAVMSKAVDEVRGGRVTCLWLPGASGAAWRVTMQEARGVFAAGGRAEVYVDPSDGRVTDIARHETGSAESKFYAWQLPLHNGSAFGLLGRITVFLSGLAPLVLGVTGLLIYLRKRRARLQRISSIQGAE